MKTTDEKTPTTLVFQGFLKKKQRKATLHLALLCPLLLGRRIGGRRARAGARVEKEERKTVKQKEESEP